MNSLVLCSLLLLPVQETKTRLTLPRNGYPMYGIAKISQDGKSMALTVPLAGELRVQEYKTAVQVQKVVKGADGKERTVTQVEQRTSKRITTKPRDPRPGKPGEKMVQQTYTVAVPRTETRTNAKGETYNVTVMVTEQRTRTVPLSLVRNMEPDRPTLYKLVDSTFFDLQGKPVESAEVAKRLSKRSPILVLTDEKELDPYFRAALKRETLLFVPPPLVVKKIKQRAEK